ncbi:hypothetical protein [Mesorhizobium comanense]|uniref:hypothetical protein n=1 Tax=Mesorhizobium comanense TaxID=2502215 RepID=UPI0010F46D98|nr:hypothetical protein [Mesorhizobium comanense]
MDASILGMPGWFLALVAICLLVVIYSIPNDTARSLADRYVRSDQAQLLGALVAIVGFVAVAMTLYQIRVDLADRGAERAVRRDEAIARAWDRLLGQAAGNTGKGDALSTLFREGIVLNGGIDDFGVPAALDLSCQTIGNWDAQAGRCRKPAIIAGANFQARPGDVPLIALDLAGNQMNGLTLAFASLSGDFTGTGLDGLNAANARLDGHFKGAAISNADIVNTDFDIGYATPDDLPGLYGVNVSGSRMSWLEGLGFKLQQLSFWADWPPTKGKLGQGTPGFADAILDQMRICKPPLDANGKPVPRAERQPMYAGRGKPADCVAVSAAQARQLYPQAYAALPPQDFTAPD